MTHVKENLNKKLIKIKKCDKIERERVKSNDFQNITG